MPVAERKGEKFRIENSFQDPNKRREKKKKN